MRLSEILSSKRISIQSELLPLDTGEAVLTELARLLGEEGGPEKIKEIHDRLIEREELQSTGIGDGVAIPHVALTTVTTQQAALVLCPQGIPFRSIDDLPVRIFWGVVGPRSDASEHLKVLARVSRLLRSTETRQRMLEIRSPQEVFELIEALELAAVPL